MNLIKSLVIFFLIIGICYADKTEIYLWHGLDVKLSEELSKLVDEFNKSNTEFVVKIVRKDNYAQAFSSGIEAVQAKKEKYPHLLHVSEVDTLTMMYRYKNLYIPASEYINMSKFDFIETVRAFYSSKDKGMLSLPFNASTGILFYNKDAFRKAGLDAEKAPATWEEMEQFSRKLLKAGYKYGFTTGWPVAYLLEHFSAWHNIPFATMDNGLSGLGARLVFNSDKHIENIKKFAQWQQDNIYHFFQTYGDEEKCFINAECAVYLNGANRYGKIKDSVKFRVGFGFVPYWKKLSSPYALNIGGGSFWVISGHKEKEYKGVKEFLEFISDKNIQARWHQNTAYLPITISAYEITKKSDYYKDHQYAGIAVESVINKPTNLTHGIRLGDYGQIRNIILKYFQQIFYDKKDVKTSLDLAVKEGNAVLENFEKNNK